MINKNSQITNQHKSPNLFIISGPSGVGKDAILNLLKKQYTSNHYVVTVTTRNKRNNDHFRVSGVK